MADDRCLRHMGAPAATLRSASRRSVRVHGGNLGVYIPCFPAAFNHPISAVTLGERRAGARDCLGGHIASSASNPRTSSRVGVVFGVWVSVLTQHRVLRHRGFCSVLVSNVFLDGLGGVFWNLKCSWFFW